MENLDFLVPVQVYIRVFIAHHLNRYPGYRQWPPAKTISYLSAKAIEKWEKSIIDHAMKGDLLPVEVVDSWADMHGVTGHGGVLHTFRGIAERAIKGWMPKDLRD